MNNPEELNLKKTSNVDVTSEELIKMQENVPLLKLANNKDPNFIILIKLIKEMSDATYVSHKKYALMYKIMQIGNLLKGLLDESITKDATAGTLKTFEDNTPLQKLLPQQQFALFNVNRNIAADFFPLLYESKMKLFIENFIRLCKGIGNSSNLADLNSSFNKITRGENLKKSLIDSTAGQTVSDKLINQMGYFLLKANHLMEKENDFDGACMALIASGSCGRIYNRGGVKPQKAAAVLANIRESISPYINEYDEKQARLIINDTLKEESIRQRIKDIETQCNSKGVNILEYYTKKETPTTKQESKETTVPESPRAFDRKTFGI